MSIINGKPVPYNIIKLEDAPSLLTKNFKNDIFFYKLITKLTKNPIFNVRKIVVQLEELIYVLIYSKINNVKVKTVEKKLFNYYVFWSRENDDFIQTKDGYKLYIIQMENATALETDIKFKEVKL